MKTPLNNPNNKPSYGLTAALRYTFLTTLLFPVSLLGYIIYVTNLMLTGRRSGVSTTAQGPLSVRWTQHYLGVREDEAAYRLLMALPGYSSLGWHLLADPTLLAYRLSGYVPKAFRYPFEGEVPAQHQSSARQTFYDEAVEHYLPDMRQFVILGAGFDTRAYRLPVDAQLKIFEVDIPKTQAIKRQLLKETGTDTSRVTFIPADFEQEDWLVKLTAAGFDPGQAALFLLEGVILYLDEEAARDTLHKIASTRGVVAFDYFTRVPLESKSLYWSFARFATGAAGEPIKFGIDSTPPSGERVAEFLQSCGLSLVKQRTLGEEGAGKRAWGGFAIASTKR